MSLLNTEIKPFQNTAFKNGKFIKISENDIKGHWSVFFFYPADFTFVCPTELGDLADYYEQFQKLGVEIYSISTDTHFSHKEWYSNSNTIRKIQYTMISDSDWTLTRNFEVMCEYKKNDEKKELGLAERGTFIIDPNGIIQGIEITAEGIGRDSSDLLRKIKAAQYIASHPGEVCPAKWRDGEPTLSPSIDLVGKI
ncbi:Alkyl hydroperoxide reductase subunit C [Candidatus Arsenophonus lipoptenae]|uniref:Alkyl hydroperoxide reductase C n=1 Tax=Candidatus Arsenophonus lipoptenae TaxID=634113 RepID=A0A0X9VZV7_9GAMM|nr:alkyl hydroperoxide reductase subunit C [Candidatus Arsenophonus lipoptenae]AMA65210.1 Alkyl hydroperoxide reductase subunit C [Candidatus Arsenophonus lipoptenae]